MALADIKQKILGEAQSKAANILAAAEKRAADKLSAAQKQLKAERQKAEAGLAQERAQALQQRRQLLLMEAGQSALALKREYLQEVLALAVKQVAQKKLPEYYTKIFREIDFSGARILTGGDTAPAAAACKTLGIEAPLTAQKDWPAGRLEVDYGKSRLDCSLSLYVRELAQTVEAELAERLWP